MVEPTPIEEWLATQTSDSFHPDAASSQPNTSDTIPEGQRDNTLAQLAGRMRYVGLHADEIVAALRVTNQRRCSPPLTDFEITKIARSIGRYPAPGSKTTDRGLEFLTIRELAERVRAAGPRRFLLRGIWPSGDYGVHAAEMKAQKTWNVTDMAVSIASGTPWLGHVPVDRPGPFLMFVGEGGEANILRRLSSIADGRGLVLNDLPIVVCARAPHLNNPAHLDQMAAKIAALRPSAVGLDPLYLSARGANGADLYAMGEMLEQAQHICQGESAALVVVTHFNRKAGEGAGRITGAGPAEWGRVLLSSIVRSRSTNPLTKETTVLTEIQIVGGEVPDQVLRVLRRVRAENPDDLDSPLHVVTSVTTADTDLEAGPQTSDVGIRLRPAAQKLLEALELGSAAQMALVDRIKTKHGHGLREETVSRELGELSKLGRVKATDPGKFQPKVWSLV